MEHSIAARLPPGVIWETLAFDEGFDFQLFPSEQVTIASAAERRRREFAAGRRCARAALARLGLGSTEIPSGPDRAPVWPPGIVGSIAHCDDLAVAAIATRSAVSGLGVDCERRLRVSSDLSPEILRPDEHDGAGLPVDPAGEWLTAVFSAKEAVYKAVYPTMRRWIEFQAVRIRFAPDGATFRAEVTIDEGRAFEGAPRGAVQFDGRHVLAAAWLPSR